MEHRMNRNARIWLMLTILIVVAVVAFVWATSRFSFPFSRWEPWERRLPPPYGIPEDIELFYTIETIFSAINVTLSVFLLLTYVSIYRKTRSEFTIGLIIFSMVFLLNAFASNPAVMWVFGYRSFGLGPFALLPDVFTFAALITLLYLSLRY